jgi:chemotaxis protein CheX
MDTALNADVPNQSGSVLMLPEVLDLRAAAPLAAELMARRGLDTELDASRVRKLGGQGLQVLLSAHACWHAEGRHFRVVAPSSDFIDGVALLGASSLIPTFGA